LDKRCTFVIDASLPLGLIANTAAVLSLSLGRFAPDLVGASLHDASGTEHSGITTAVMPILKGDADGIRALRAKAEARADSELFIVDVTDAAQTTKSYSDYEAKLAGMATDELRYLGICLYGPAAVIKSLTGNLPLLR
jgi:hypothetical protein